MAEKKAGVIVILSSPSGAGKTTLVKKISSRKNYKISISHTTRKPRINEKDGRDYFFVKNKNLPEQIANVNKPLYNFLLNKWYFDELYDVLIVRSSKKLGLFLWKFFDIKLIDGFGPDGISAFIKKCSLKANKFQSGFIYQYAFVMLLGFSALLTFLIVK